MKTWLLPLLCGIAGTLNALTPEALEAADGLVSLPMAGAKSSINVGNAAAAILYAVLARAGVPEA